MGEEKMSHADTLRELGVRITTRWEELGRIYAKHEVPHEAQQKIFDIIEYYIEISDIQTRLNTLIRAVNDSEPEETAKDTKAN